VSPRREAAAVLVLVAVGSLLLLLTEPATGLAALAGVGAATLVGPRARIVVAAAVCLLGLAVVWLGLARSDVVLAVGGALVAVAGAAAAVRVRRWPAPRREAAAPQGDLTARDTWEALDRGEDPTA